MADYELAPAAEHDLREIANYTVETWGLAQGERYEASLSACLEGMAAGSRRVRRPIPHRPEILVCRCEEHYVFAVRRIAAPLLVVAVLHRSMDLMARLAERLEPKA